MGILAIDQATKFGYATSLTNYGSLKLRKKAKEPWGLLLSRFKEWLTTASTGMDAILYEIPSGRFKGAIIPSAKLVGVIELHAHENNLKVLGVSSTAIKKWATGKGNANKQAMLEAAEERFEIKTKDDDAIDALFLWHYVSNNLQLLHEDNEPLLLR